MERDRQAIYEMCEMLFPEMNFKIENILNNVNERLKRSINNIDLDFTFRGNEIIANINRIAFHRADYHISIDLYRFSHIHIKDRKKYMEEELYYMLKSAIQEYWLSLIFKECE